MQQSHVFISGTVQGVGFRQFVRWISKKCGVTGWVQNLPDGRVEALLQGEKQYIEHVLTACKKGPPLAQVTDVQITWEEETEVMEGFEIRREQFLMGK